MALPASSPMPPPSGIGGAPRSPATCSEPQVASIGTSASRRSAIASDIACTTCGLAVLRSRGVFSGSSGRRASARRPAAGAAARRTPRRSGCRGSRRSSGRPSACSTWQASVSPVASQTLSRSPSARITSAAITRFSCSCPRRRARRLLAPVGQPVQHVVVDHPGAHRALALLAADDAREALEPLRRGWAASRSRWRSSPSRGGSSTGRFFGPKTPGRWASASVPHAHVEAARVPSRPGSPASLVEHPAGRRHALLGQGVGHVRHHRVVGVQHVAGAVGGGGVDPRHAAAARPGGAAGRGRRCALPISRNVSIVRSCSALASRIAQTLAADHGISTAGASMT